MPGQLTPASPIVRLARDLLVMVLALTVHECAHAFMAFRLGDDTAKRQGRLSLSPVTHIDPVGSLLMPALGIILGGFSFIGWARPTPFTPTRFRSSVPMRVGSALVAAAGPVSNLLLGTLSLLLIAALPPSGAELRGPLGGIKSLLEASYFINVGLFVFNLLPLAPLDGAYLLPRSLDELSSKIAPFSLLILLVILNVPVLSQLLIGWPVRFVMLGLESLLGVRVWGEGPA